MLSPSMSMVVSPAAAAPATSVAACHDDESVADLGQELVAGTRNVVGY